MKITTILFLSFSFTLSLNSQTHEVIHHKGNIIHQKTNKPLKKDSQFKKKDQLEFQQLENWLITLETQSKKNYLVHLKKNRQHQVFTNFQLLPYKIQNRPGYILSGVDLVNYLNEGNHYLVVGKETHIPVNRNGFPMNQDTFFYLNYDYRGFGINKKLSMVEDGLVLNKDSLFQVRFSMEEYYRQVLKDTERPIAEPKRDTFIQIDPAELTIQENQYIKLNKFNFDTVSYRTNVALHYFDGKGDISIKAPTNPNTSTLTNRPFLPFHLIFLSDEVVEEALAPLLESGVFNGNEDRIERLTAFLEERFGGKLEEGDLGKWLEEQGL